MSNVCLYFKLNITLNQQTVLKNYRKQTRVNKFFVKYKGYGAVLTKQKGYKMHAHTLRD